MISEELKKQNYEVYLQKLNSIGIDTKLLVERLGDKLMNATYALDSKSNCAYDGSFIHTILRTTTVFAVKINELLDESIKVDKNSLIKVCLLYQISKAETLIPNDNAWEIENRGIRYKYAESSVALKCGMKSLILCQECGISFTPQEIEAMTILDREDNDIQAKCYANPISVILRQANELTIMKNRLIGNNG